MPRLLPSRFTEAYGRFWPPIQARCRRILGRTALAEEIAQETFVRFWQAGPALDATTETRTIMAWLYVTSTRLATDALREGRLVSFDETVEAPAACAASPAAVAQARSSILALSKRVSPEEIEAAILTRLDGLAHAEAGLLLGVSERTVRRLLERFDAQSAELREEVMGG